MKARKMIQRMLCMFILCSLLCGIFPGAQAAELPEVRVKITDEKGELLEQSLHGGYLLEPVIQYHFWFTGKPTANLMMEVTFTHVSAPEGETITEENAVLGESFVYDVPINVVSGVSYCSIPDISVRQDTLVQFRPHFSTLDEEIPDTADGTPDEEIPDTTDGAPEEEIPDTTDEESSSDQLPLWEQIPTYYQNDYPGVRYGSGTLEFNGCSAVSLAMVATYMTGHTYLPDEIAKYIGIVSSHNADRLEAGCELLQIPYTKAKDFNETYDALQEGKVAIILVHEESSFTNSQHFMVLAGMNGDKIMVHDPNRNNQSTWEMAQGFKDGFTKKKILNGYSSGWIFDKAEMPEEPFIYTPPQPEYAVPRYPDITLPDDQIELMARLIWNESRGEPFEGQQAVAEVLLNRYAIDITAKNMSGIIHGAGQFRNIDSLEDARPTQAQYDAIEYALKGPYILPKNIRFFATYKMNNNVWGTIGNHTFCGEPIE